MRADPWSIDLDEDGPRTLIDAAYRRLMRDIVEGRHAPGDKLRIAHLKEIYQVSGGTLREALSLLVSQSLVVAGGLEDEAAFLPLIVERLERQVEALRRMAALEALLAAQAMDILGDQPKGVVEMIYRTARAHAAFYVEDRPLSADVEAIEGALGSDGAMAELLALAPLPEIDIFFALDPGFTKSLAA